jgi:hypothetical protein
MTTYGFRPWGLRGFCLGSVGSYGGTFAGCGVGAGDQRAVTWPTMSSEIRWHRHTGLDQLSLTLWGTELMSVAVAASRDGCGKGQRTAFQLGQ